MTSADMEGALQSFFKGRGGIAVDGSLAGAWNIVYNATTRSILL